MNAIIKPATPCDPREIYIAYMFASYVRAPGRKTGPGEPVDPSRQCQQITSLWLDELYFVFLEPGGVEGLLRVSVTQMDYFRVRTRERSRVGR